MIQKNIHEQIKSLAKDSDTYRSVVITDFNRKAFKNDICVFFIIRKMIRRFLIKGEISEKLLLNNIIICLNVFGIESVNKILRLITTDDEFGIVKACLKFLNSYHLPDDRTVQNVIITDILRDIKQRYNLDIKF